jgi:hypothetical protein
VVNSDVDGYNSCHDGNNEQGRIVMASPAHADQVRNGLIQKIEAIEREVHELRSAEQISSLSPPARLP